VLNNIRGRNPLDRDTEKETCPATAPKKPNPLSTTSTGKGLSHALRRQEEEKKKNSGKVALGAEDQGTKP
jgi:hypothetical protein